MDNFSELVDAERVQRAKAAFAALKVAETEADAAVEAAQQAVDAAEETSVAAAHAGKPDKTLEALEVACEDAARSHAVTRKKHVAAKARVETGEAKLREEVRQAHAPALAAGFARRVKILREAHALVASLKALDAEFLAIRVECLKIDNASGKNMMAITEMLPGGIFMPSAPEKLVDLADFLPHVIGRGVDPETGRAPWMKE